jgi:hypothetical protein
MIHYTHNTHGTRLARSLTEGTPLLRNAGGYGGWVCGIGALPRVQGL